MTSLNPVFTVGYQLCEPLRFHLHMHKEEAEKRAVELLRMVGLSSPESVCCNIRISSLAGCASA